MFNPEQFEEKAQQERAVVAAQNRFDELGRQLGDARSNANVMVNKDYGKYLQFLQKYQVLQQRFMNEKQRIEVQESNDKKAWKIYFSKEENEREKMFRADFRWEELKVLHAKLQGSFEELNQYIKTFIEDANALGPQIKDLEELAKKDIAAAEQSGTFCKAAMKAGVIGFQSSSKNRDSIGERLVALGQSFEWLEQNMIKTMNQEAKLCQESAKVIGKEDQQTLFQEANNASWSALVRSIDAAAQANSSLSTTTIANCIREMAQARASYRGAANAWVRHRVQPAKQHEDHEKMAQFQQQVEEHWNAFLHQSAILQSAMITMTEAIQGIEEQMKEVEQRWNEVLLQGH